VASSAEAVWTRRAIPPISNEEPEIDELAAKQVYEFAFVMQPLKAQGFTGFTVAPVAIR
jgi:hypothetical protein